MNVQFYIDWRDDIKEERREKWVRIMTILGYSNDEIDGGNFIIECDGDIDELYINSSEYSQRSIINLFGFMNPKPFEQAQLAIVEKYDLVIGEEYEDPREREFLIEHGRR